MQLRQQTGQNACLCGHWKDVGAIVAKSSFGEFSAFISMFSKFHFLVFDFFPFVSVLSLPNLFVVSPLPFLLNSLLFSLVCGSSSRFKFPTRVPASCKLSIDSVSLPQAGTGPYSTVFPKSKKPWNGQPKGATVLRGRAIR